MGDRSLGRLIRKRRESLGLSQSRLGELVGRSASTIRNWEREKSTPGARSDAVALAAVLGLEEAEVLERAGFEVDGDRSHETVEEAYASLAPRPSVDPEPSEETEPREETESDPPSQEQPDQPPIGATPTPNIPHAIAFDRAVKADEPGTAEDEEQVSLADEPQQVEVDEAVPTPSDSPEEVRDEGGPFDREEGGSFAEERVPDSIPEPDTEPPVFDLPDPFDPEFVSGVSVEEGADIPRAAPPTVLELATPGEPSYLEDPEQRQHYRMRALVTAGVVLFLVIMLIWSFNRATDALGAMWEEFVSLLEL